jgi:hypothetical protein
LYASWYGARRLPAVQTLPFAQAVDTPVAA